MKISLLIYESLLHKCQSIKRLASVTTFLLKFCKHNSQQRSCVLHHQREGWLATIILLTDFNVAKHTQVLSFEEKLRAQALSESCFVPIMLHTTLIKYLNVNGLSLNLE